MGTTGIETETGFYKRQFRFFQPEPEYFLTIPVLVEMEPEFQILVPVPEKVELEIDFCRNSSRNSVKNQDPVPVLPEPELIFEIPVPFQPEPDWLKNILVPVERTGIVFFKFRFPVPFRITPFRSYPILDSHCEKQI